MSNAVELFKDRASELASDADAKGIKARIHIENPMVEKSWYMGQVLSQNGKFIATINGKSVTSPASTDRGRPQQRQFESVRVATVALVAEIHRRIQAEATAAMAAAQAVVAGYSE